MLSYSMFGSCVTRDASDLGRWPLPRPVQFFSRCKVQSLVSSPTPVEGDDIGLASAFQTRVVLEDHRKTAVPVLAALDHPLVIDLIDERLPLLDSGHGLVTGSLYLRNSSLVSEHSYASVPEDSPPVLDGAFAKACESLAGRLSGVEVIVHRALWATRSVTGEQLPKRDYAERSNRWLRCAYDILEATLPARATITPAPELVVADPGHRWGLDPFHYIPAYYDDVSSQLRGLL